MEDHLDFKCIVCLENYDDHHCPKNLDCGHCVCSQCLEAMSEYANSNSKECPECRQNYKAKSHLDLQTNYPVVRLSRMRAFAREVSEKESPLNVKMIICTPEATTKILSAGTCSSHGYSLYFACLRCEKYICRECLVNDHIDPPYGYCIIYNIRDLADKRKRPLMEKLESDLKKITATRNKYAKIAKKFKKFFAKIEDTADSSNSTNFQYIVSHKEELTAQIATYDSAIECIKETMERLRNAMWPFLVNKSDTDSWEGLLTHDKYKIKQLTRSFQEAQRTITNEQGDIKDSTVNSDDIVPV